MRVEVIGDTRAPLPQLRARVPSRQGQPQAGRGRLCAPGRSHRQFPYEGQIWFFRAAAVIAPFFVYFAGKRVCEELRARGGHPLRGWTGRVVGRTPSGGFDNRDSNR